MLKLGDEYNLAQTTFVVTAGLLLAALLNLDGLHAWAKRLPHGKFREIAVTWTKEPAEFYQGASLDWPKQWLSSLFESLRLDLRAKDTMRAEETGPPPGAAPTEQGAVTKEVADIPAAVKPEPTQAAGQKRVLIMGDSMMVGALGRVLEAEFQTTPFEPVRRAKISTGLARPDYFNWEEEVKRVYSETSIDLAIVMLGGNDTQDIKAGKKRFAFGSKSWAKIYAKRLSAILDHMCKQSSTVVWLGAPPMKLSKYNYKMMWLNGVVEETVRQHKCAKYFPTVSLFSKTDGSYASYGSVFGKYRQIRMADGIHLTRSGGHLLAEALLNDLAVKRVKR